ncbi:MAG: glycosyltransferase family 39 protein [Anaerolineaceae bacterium]|nr:glycosyltransferase family 39 protein [Anaerolineaceae bacterium]
MRKKNPFVSAIIAFSWFFLIIIGYYVTHKPVNPSQTITFITHTWKIFLGLGVITLAGGLGRIFFRFENHPAWVRCYLQTGIGIGILSILILIIASTWNINLLIIIGLIILSGLIAFKSSIAWLIDLFNKEENERQKSTRSTKIIVILLGLIFLSQLLVSLAPATRYDALNYHLTLPKTYLLQEKISDIPWLVMSGMPQVSEMIYTALMGLGGESSVLVFNGLIGALISLGLVGYLRNRLDQESALVGVASLFSGFTFASALSWGYVDLMAAFFGLGVVILLDDYRKSGGEKAVFLAGIFSGLAFGCKYPAGVIFLAGLLALVIYFLKNKTKNGFKSIGLFCLGAGLLALPWLIKNFAFTGNPIYPFFFESGSMNQIRLNVYQGMEPYGNLLDLFFLPIRATIMGVDGAHGYSVSIGPLLLGLGVIALLGWEEKDPEHKLSIVNAGLIAFFGLLVWAIGNQFSGYLIQTRFYFVLFPAFAILAAFGYFQIKQYQIGQVRIKRLVDIFMIVVLAFNSFQLISEMVEKDVLPNVFGYQSNQEYLEKNLGWYARAIDEINLLDEGERVLFLYEPRGFGCIPKCDPDEILDQWKVTYHEFKSTEEIIITWKNDGFTHILVYTRGMEFLREEQDPHHPPVELDALEKLTTSLSLVANYGDWYKLYFLGGN